MRERAPLYLSPGRGCAALRLRARALYRSMIELCRSSRRTRIGCRLGALHGQVAASCTRLAHLHDSRMLMSASDVRFVISVSNACRHAHACAPRQRSRVANWLTSKRDSRAHYVRHAAIKSETLSLQAALHRRSTERATPCCSASTRNPLAPPKYAFTTFSFNGLLCFAMKNIPQVESMSNCGGQIDVSKRRRLNVLARDRATPVRAEICWRRIRPRASRRKHPAKLLSICEHTGRWETAASESCPKRLKTIL